MNLIFDYRNTFVGGGAQTSTTDKTNTTAKKPASGNTTHERRRGQFNDRCVNVTKIQSKEKIDPVS